MNIIPPSYTIVSPASYSEGVDKLRFIERMARISHRSEDKQTDWSWDRFLRAVVVGHGDWSVVEHASATVIFQVNRGTTHELVRHRLFSFTQESTRFVNYTKPEHVAFYIVSCGVRPEDRAEWENDFGVADAIYRKWLARGYAPQIARDHLPNGLAAQIAVTGNLRSWRWFFLVRTTIEAHPDFKAVAIPLLDHFKQLIPILYEDIEPLLKQSESMRGVH